MMPPLDYATPRAGEAVQWRAGDLEARGLTREGILRPKCGTNLTTLRAGMPP